MNTREILDMALNVETLAEKIYLDLSRLFPEAKAFFEQLSCEESRHADIMAINMGFLSIDALPPEFAIDMVPLIRKTLAVAAQLESRIEAKEITLTEAVRLAVEMEEAGIEAYFQNVMRGESVDGALNYLKQFYVDSRHHADALREFGKSLGAKTEGQPLTMTHRRSKMNCWEFKRCGRQPEGIHAQEPGSCPAATEEILDGVHDGVNAGRACWVVAGTLCRGEIQGSFAQKIKDCGACDFYNKVHTEERSVFQFSALLLAKLEKR